MSVRAAEDADAEALARLWWQGWHDAHAAIVPAELTRLRVLDNFRDRMRAALPAVRTIGRPGQPIGFHYVTGDELNQFYVATGARGSGVASVLIADAEARMSARGVETAWLACSIGNLRAARFYEKSGWRLAATASVLSETSAGPYPLDVWRYEKRLAPVLLAAVAGEHRMKLETDRLILREWAAEDLEPFAAMSADPQVMRWLGGCLSQEQVEAYMARAALSFATLRMGRFAIERRSDGAFVGACGLMPGREDLPIAPYVDIGWRLTPTAWGHGYASEAAAAVLRDGFGRLGLEEVAAITMQANHRSRAVMERLGMVRDAASDFDDPALKPPDDPRTVVYRVRR